jgi:hypothetical protein
VAGFEPEEDPGVVLVLVLFFLFLSFLLSCERDCMVFSFFVFFTFFLAGFLSFSFYLSSFLPSSWDNFDLNR